MTGGDYREQVTRTSFTSSPPCFDLVEYSVASLIPESHAGSPAVDSTCMCVPVPAPRASVDRLFLISAACSFPFSGSPRWI